MEEPFMNPNEPILVQTGLTVDEYRKKCMEDLVQNELKNLGPLFGPIREIKVPEFTPSYVEYQRFEGIGGLIVEIGFDFRDFSWSLKKFSEDTSALKTQLDYEGVIYPI